MLSSGIGPHPHVYIRMYIIVCLSWQDIAQWLRSHVGSWSHCWGTDLGSTTYSLYVLGHVTSLLWSQFLMCEVGIITAHASLDCCEI